VTRPRVFAALAILLMVVQTVLSSFPMPAMPAGPWFGTDKILHGMAWAAMGACLALAAPRPRWTTALVAVALAVGFGALDELHQSYVPGRDASVKDLLADLTGALVGASVATWYGRRRWRSGPSAA